MLGFLRSKSEHYMFFTCVINQQMHVYKYVTLTGFIIHFLYDYMYTVFI